MSLAPTFTSDAEEIVRPPLECRPLVSIVVPAYNEAAIVEENLKKICDYMKSIESCYRWKLIVVNDGSTDGTGEIAEAFAKRNENVLVLHHFVNFRLGQALRFAFSNCLGDFIVTLDLDLSYSPDHVERLLRTIIETKSKIVIASPYMSEGKVSNVPWLRKTLSRWANRYLSATAPGKITTLTGMVRAYDARFLKCIDLKSQDTDINEEIIFKAQMLGARITEIPAHLDWSFRKSSGQKRISSLKISKKIISCLASGFLFRPFLFFIVLGLVLLVLSMYSIMWAMIHTIGNLFDYNTFSLSYAIAEAYKKSPHSFVVGGFSLMVSFQLIGLGLIALQNKKYYEDLFHLNNIIYRNNIEMKGGIVIEQKN